MQDSEEVKDILSKLTSLDRALTSAKVWARNPTEANAIVPQRRLDILDIRKYLNKHLLVVITLEERLREARELNFSGRKKLMEAIAKSPVVKPVDARDSYSKQIDNLTF
jgi:hypothetical protein